MPNAAEVPKQTSAQLGYRAAFVWVTQITERCEHWDTDIGPVEVRNQVETKNATICDQGDFSRRRHHLDGWLALVIGCWDKVAGR
jgi:hypothetical protein